MGRVREQGNFEQMSTIKTCIITEFLGHKFILYMIAVFNKVWIFIMRYIKAFCIFYQVKTEFDKVVGLRDEALNLHFVFEKERLFMLKKIEQRKSV